MKFYKINGIKFSIPLKRQQNGKSDITYRWAEPFNCDNLEQLNEALEATCRINREEYPCDHLEGKTRAEAYPKLLDGESPFSLDDFDLKKVLGLLAKGSWVRKTSPKGAMSFFSQYWNLTTHYKHRHVYVHLDEEANEWVVSLDQAEEIKRFPNDFVTNEKILKLDLKELNLQNFIAHNLTITLLRVTVRLIGQWHEVIRSIRQKKALPDLQGGDPAAFAFSKRSIVKVSV